MGVGKGVQDLPWNNPRCRQCNSALGTGTHSPAEGRHWATECPAEAGFIWALSYFFPCRIASPHPLGRTSLLKRWPPHLTPKSPALLLAAGRANLRPRPAKLTAQPVNQLKTPGSTSSPGQEQKKNLPAFVTRLLTPRSRKPGYGLLLGCRSGFDAGREKKTCF